MRAFTKTAVAFLLTLAAAGPLGAADDPIDRIVGTWVSPDGSVRQQVERELDGTWLATRQWFKRDGEWLLVGRGALYPKPGEDAWFGATRTVQMGGIALFESTFRPGEELLTVESRAYMEDGSVLETVEEWRFPSADRIDYTVYRVTDEGREPWTEGSWVRSEVGRDR